MIARKRPRCELTFGCLCVLASLLLSMRCTFAQESPWVRPQKPGDPLMWGRRDGILFALPFEGEATGVGPLLRATPRGLIRVGFFTPDKAEPQLLNFLAVEPVIKGPGRRFDRLGFSELEMSTLDPGQRGKRLSVHAEAKGFAEGGALETVQVGNAKVERLTVRIDVEKFTANGAHVYLVLSIDSDHPSELRVATFAEKDSPPLEDLSVTATMGNYERLRQVWLKDRVVDSRTLFGDYAGEAFVEQQGYTLNEMLRTNDGDAIVFCTSDEASPRDSDGNATAHWPFALPKVTQYWRVPGSDVQPDLRVRVNARRVYWASTIPVLGGIAFENFEVRQRYVPGQVFVYGITQQEPMPFLHEFIRREMLPPTPAALPAGSRP